MKPTLAPSLLLPFEPLSSSQQTQQLQLQPRNSYEISPKCQIDSKTGILQEGCLAKAQLQPIPVSKESQSLLLHMNETIVLSGKLKDHASPFQGGRKGNKIIPTEDLVQKRIRQWRDFKQWLTVQAGKTQIPYEEDGRAKVLEDDKDKDETETVKENDMTKKRPFDVVLDGANIGYYQTNFNGAPKHVDYHQINWLIQHLNNLNKKVLLILHERHFHPNLMPRYAETIVDSWKQGNDLLQLYQAPYGSNDDWFWFHAAIWCGEGTMVVTNDEMRDHFFQMLTYGMFLRWKERHQIHFSFGDWDVKDSNGRNRRRVKLVFPDIYSRRIQRVEILNDVNDEDSHADSKRDAIHNSGIVIPLPKRGDENRFLDGMHVASETEPMEETYLCIRPMTQN